MNHLSFDELDAQYERERPEVGDGFAYVPTGEDAQEPEPHSACEVMGDDTAIDRIARVFVLLLIAVVIFAAVHSAAPHVAAWIQRVMGA